MEIYSKKLGCIPIKLCKTSLVNTLHQRGASPQELTPFQGVSKPRSCGLPQRAMT